MEHDVATKEPYLRARSRSSSNVCDGRSIGASASSKSACAQRAGCINEGTNKRNRTGKARFSLNC